MKTIFILDIHSVLDVITNSSSELFVINDETSVEVVEEMLSFMLEKWNEMAEKGIFYRRDKFTPLMMEDVMSVGILQQEDIEEEQYKWGYEHPENVGKIIIESACSNSIPYEIIEWIESAFSVKRWHI